MGQAMTVKNEKVFKKLEDAIVNLREAISTGDKSLVAIDLGHLLVATRDLIEKQELDIEMIFRAADTMVLNRKAPVKKKAKRKQRTK